jgi:hypothetical protein
MFQSITIGSQSRKLLMVMTVIGNCHQGVNQEALMKRQDKQNKLEAKILT